MAGYIGSGASVVSSGAERKKVFDITTNTTSLTGLNYTVGKVHVYHNGVRLVDGTDYTATNSTSITLTVAAVSGDQVVVVSYASFQVSDALPTTGGTLTGDLSFGDNDKAKFGAGDDLNVWHNGSHSYVQDTGTGNLYLAGSNVIISNPTATETMAYFDDDGGASLWYDNSVKLATTSTGIDVTGTVTSETSASGVQPLLKLYQANNTSGNKWGIDFSRTTGSASDDVVSKIYANREGGDATGLTFDVTESGGTTSEAMRISSGGNVGIGNTSSGYIFTAGETRLSVGDGAEHAGIQVLSGTNKWGGLEFADDTTDSNAQGLIAYYHPDNYMQFKTNGTERMRLDSSGNVLVSQTTTADPASANIVGTGIGSVGYISTSRSGNPAAYFNRFTSDGDIALFLRGGTTVGSVGTIGGNPYFSTKGGSNQCGIMPVGGSDPRVIPVNATGSVLDNGADLGYSNARWDDIWATNGSIQTSDFNEKQDIATLTATEMLVGKRISALFKTFRWKDSVAEKGDNARTHTGVIAQDVQAAFTAEGLDAGDYALFISNTWWEHDVEVPAVEAVEAVEEVVDEDGNVTTEAVEAKDAYTRTDTYETEAEAPEGATSKTRLGIRYPELLSFVAAYNEQRFASIEARLTALEA